MTLQIRSLKVQVDGGLSTGGTRALAPSNRRYLGEGLGARSTDKRFLSSVSPLVVLQVRLVFKRLQTGETQSVRRDTDKQSVRQVRHSQSNRKRGETQTEVRQSVRQTGETQTDR